MENGDIASHSKPSYLRKSTYIVSGIFLGMLYILFLFYLFFPGSMHTQQKKTITRTANPLPKISTVILTNTGFSPEEITVQKGEAVTWNNNSNNNNASINSDDYPTNRRFPELNLGKVNKGSSVIHIFNTPGTFTYHNQFNPKQTGTIIVK